MLIATNKIDILIDWMVIDAWLFLFIGISVDYVLISGVDFVILIDMSANGF